MNAASRDLWRAWTRALSAPVDIASLAAFRMLFGAVMCAALVRSLAKGWVTTFFVEPTFHFTYAPFWFVHPWPGIGMYVHFAATALAALGVALGLCFRASAVAFFLGFTYIELLDKATYLNHYYLVSLLAALLALSPAGRAFSLDAALRPTIRAATVPAWVVQAFRYQVALVYVFAGVAKLNRDWLVEAQPLRIWLSARGDMPLVGALLEQPLTAHVASWAGAAFDLAIVPLLLAAKTRAPAYACLIGFHVATAALFPIGMFPWIMVAAATLFFPPSWPRRFLHRVMPADARAPAWSPPRWLGPLLAAHCALQTALPVRRLTDTTSSAWTLRGFNFAWNVMVAEKTGHVVFRARDRATTRTVVIEPSDILAPFQERAMAQDPDMIRAFGAELARRLGSPGHAFAVHAEAFASLNGRPARLMIDPAIDLAGAVPDSFVLPLE